MTPAAYDHVIVGAGVSGILLADQLLRAPGAAGAGPRILLVDPSPVSERPVTLAFWTRRPTPLDPWTLGSWDRLVVRDHDGGQVRHALPGLSYVATSWDRARTELLNRLVGDPRVDLLDGTADEVRDAGTHAEVVVDGRVLAGTWAFDSRPPDPTTTATSGRGTALLQSFRGAWVTTRDPVVATGAATFADFSAPGPGSGMRFGYVLPVAADRVLVMAVRMAADDEAPDPLPLVARLLGPDGWHVDADESGVIALTTPPAPRRLGRRVLAIGQRGGLVRPSTGYAVTRILADAVAISRSLQQHGHPFDVPGDPRAVRAMDAIWLRALSEQPDRVATAMAALLARARTGPLLRFLDGRPRPSDIAHVVAVLPPGPFVGAAARLALPHPHAHPGRLG